MKNDEKNFTGQKSQRSAENCVVTVFERPRRNFNRSNMSASPYPIEVAPGASADGKVKVAVGGGGGFIGSWYVSRSC